MANIKIDIASEFTGRRAFNQAEKSVTSLDMAVTKLGNKLTTAFSAYKVAQFARASVQAFADDQKSAALLAKTLENVNQGYQTDMVEKYISKAESLYGILDEKLRPAFSTLVVATKDAALSQKLLQTSLDVSAGTGKDLESVTAALAKAYLGNTTALARLGVGLSKADLKSKSFNDIVTTLSQNFAGAAATAADTYQGKLDRLNVAFDKMKETIGQGIIQGFEQLDGSQGFNSVIDKMGQLAQYISDATVGLGVVASKIQTVLSPLGKIGGGVLKTAILGAPSKGLDILAALGARTRTASSQAPVVTNFLSDMKQIAATVGKINDKNKANLTTQKALTKQQQDQLALQKASLALKQAEGIFNMDQIEIAAAMLNKQTAEDYARLQLKKDILALQDAINAGDAAAATVLADKVNADYKIVAAYQAQNAAATVQAQLLNQIGSLANAIPMNKDLINLDNLKATLDYLNSIMAKMTSITTTAKSSPTQAGGIAAASVAPVSYAGANYLTNTSTLAGIAAASGVDMNNLMGRVDTSSLAGIASASGVTLNTLLGHVDTSTLAGIAAASAGQAPVVNITVTDNANKLVDVVMDITQQQDATGITTRVNRNSGALAW